MLWHYVINSGGKNLKLSDLIGEATEYDKKLMLEEKSRRVGVRVLEGVVNALIHRNYLEVGSEVHIDMFDDRLEIYSPGGMFDGSRIQDRDLMNVPSRRRNPIIADIFNRLKYMDRRGSGFKWFVSIGVTKSKL